MSILELAQTHLSSPQAARTYAKNLEGAGDTPITKSNFSLADSIHNFGSELIKFLANFCLGHKLLFYENSYRNIKRKPGSVQWWTDPDRYDICRALAGEVQCEVDGSRLKGVRVLLHLFLHDLKDRAIERSTDDLPISVQAAVEPRIDSEQLPVPLAREDAQPILRTNLRNVEERVVPAVPHLETWIVALDRERVRELRLTTVADPIESINQRPHLGVFPNTFS